MKRGVLVLETRYEPLKLHHVQEFSLTIDSLTHH